MIKKLLICMGIVFLAAACGRSAQNSNQNTHLNAITNTGENFQKPAAEPSASEGDWEKQSKEYAAGQVKQMEEYNEEFAKGEMGKYLGLPLPKEDDKTIQSYQGVVTSSAGKSTIYSLNTYSKAWQDLNDFAGELGYISGSFYECNNISKICSPTTIIDEAVNKKVTGIYPGLGYCILGWDSENKRMFSYQCGEGGDSTHFTEFDYGKGEVHLAADIQDSFLSMNPSLTYFILQHDEQVNSTFKTTQLKVYSVENMSKPEYIVDLTKLVSANEMAGFGGYYQVSDSKWDSDKIFNFTFVSHNFILDANTGKVTAQ